MKYLLIALSLTLLGCESSETLNARCKAKGGVRILQGETKSICIKAEVIEDWND